MTPNKRSFCRYAECRYVQCRGAQVGTTYTTMNIFYPDLEKCHSIERQCTRRTISTWLTFCNSTLRQPQILDSAKDYLVPGH